MKASVFPFLYSFLRVFVFPGWRWLPDVVAPSLARFHSLDDV